MAMLLQIRPVTNRLAVLTLGLLVSAHVHTQGLAGQVVTGEVVDSISGLPVGAGFVVLVDQLGNEVSRVLSTSDGHFRFDATGAGRLRLRSERIGYRSSISEPLDIRSGQTLSYTLRVTAIPIVLATVDVLGEDRCQIGPHDAAETALVWDEIRKALTATAWEGAQDLARYRLYSYERELNGDRGITTERGRTLEGMAGQPYRSLPAEQLGRDGYVIVSRQGEVQYALPDAGVLINDTFLDRHCFYVVRDVLNRPEQVGLAFDPVSEQAITDVRGILWLDQTTSELRTLEVTYTNLPEGVEDSVLGGTVDFLRLPSGAWIVQRWQVRTPILLSYRPPTRVRGRGVRPSASVLGYRDIGGEVLEITTGDGVTIYPAALSHVTGLVYDSTKAMPLPGVRVSISETGFWTESDTAGFFHLTVPLEGDYDMVVSHPWLDSIAYVVEHPIRLERERNLTVSIPIPHAQTIREQLCPQVPDALDLGVIVGIVTGSEESEPVPGVNVTAQWHIIDRQEERLVPRDVEVMVPTNDGGFFTLCGIPTGHPVTVQAERGRTSSQTASLIFPRGAAGDLLFDWNRDPDRGYAHHSATGYRIWKLDFRLNEPGTEGRTQTVSHTLSGYVVDGLDGEPLRGVTVGMNGRDSTVTREDGTFDIIDVEWSHGPIIVAMRRLGYLPWVQEFWIEGERHRLDLSVRLRPQAIALDPVDVTAVAAEEYLQNVGFYRRQKFSTGGHFLDPDEIEERLGRVSYVTELLTGLAGVRVIEGVPGLTGSSVKLRGIHEACSSPLTFVDGFRVEVVDLEHIVRPDEIHAIEVYRTPSELPAQYGGAESACGVILVWTRRGR